MSAPRPTLAQHETRISLIEQGREHDAERGAAVLKTLQEIRDEMKALREHVDTKIDSLSDRQTKTETRLDTMLAEAKGTVRGVKIGWAAAFAAIGGGIVAAASKIMELLQ